MKNRFGERQRDFGGSDLRKATPEEMAGVVDSVMRPTGQETFDALSKAEQDELLGPDLADAVRAGKVKLSELVDRSSEDFITQAPAKDLGIEAKD